MQFFNDLVNRAEDAARGAAGDLTGYIADQIDPSTDGPTQGPTPMANPTPAQIQNGQTAKAPGTTLSIPGISSISPVILLGLAGAAFFLIKKGK